MSAHSKNSEPVFILSGANPLQYTEARRKLDLLPSQAYWLTRPSNLVGKHRPKVYRFGDWKALQNLREIEQALALADAEVTDI